jgi:hypothetical protein
MQIKSAKELNVYQRGYELAMTGILVEPGFSG